MTVRKFVLAIATLFWIAASASAQDAYPTRPVRLIIGFAAGSTADVAARIIVPKMGELLGQPVVVENRPGGGSSLSIDYVAHAPKDGYTILLGTVAATINATLAPSKTADFARDLAPVALVASIPNILVVNPSLDVSDVKGLIAYAKANPDKLFYGSAGIGSSPHLTAELFKQMAGIKITGVQYPGSAQAVTDLIAGRVQLMFSPASTVLSFVKQGSLRALASTESKRASIAPDLPTVSEAGLDGFDTGVWSGFLVPVGTSPSIIQKISNATNQALKDPGILQRLHAQGIEALGGTSEEFKKFIDNDLQRWARVIKDAHITVER